jgi:hypothetical protein
VTLPVQLQLQAREVLEVPENPYGLTDAEMQEISMMAASAERTDPNLLAGMLSGSPQAANVGSQLQAQQTRGRQQRLRSLEGALQARAQGRATTARQTGLQQTRFAEADRVRGIQRQEEQSDAQRDREWAQADLQFKREQAMDLADLRNQRMLSQSEKEKARLKRQERQMRFKHHKTQQPRPLSNSESKALHDQSRTIQYLKASLTEFKDDYASALGIVGRAQNLLSSEAGIITSKAVDEQAAWWRQYKRFIELVERHEFFGATLTKGENISWKQAEINPGMKPSEIRKNLTKRLDMMQEFFKDYASGVSMSKKNPGAVSQIIGIPSNELPSGVEPFPEDVLQDAVSGGVEKALEDMSEEELQEALEELGG